MKFLKLNFNQQKIGLTLNPVADKELRSGIEAFRLGATAARVRKSLIGLSKTGPLAQLALPLVFSKFG